MRRTGTSAPKWMYNPDESLAGIAMGSDACSEHEWGTKSMRSSFELKGDEVDGIDRRIIQVVPKGLTYDEKKVRDYLFFIPGEFYKQADRWVDDGEMRRWRDEPLVTGWDEKSFGIIAYGDEDRKNLKALWEAFQNKDVAFWTNIGVFHTGGGLIFAIVSKVREQDKKTMLENDLDIKALKQAATDTGIEQELEKAGKRYFALSPKWAKNINGSKTKYPVVFWLNPMQQDIHNYGYFTVEQLREWAVDKGPIMGGRKSQR